jgi:hypothetical protein
MSNLPAWPAKLTREQQRSVKQRRKEFDALLKGKARAAGWRFVRGEVFRQTGDWFINIMPSLLWERGAIVRMMTKPMALDPVFWNIVGLNENEALPLSFRATGAWVLRPPSIDDHVGLDTIEVEPLAAKVLDWSNQRATAVLQSISLKSMLAALPDEQHLRGQHRALAICLNIMMNDLDGAMRLCRVDDPATHPLMREGGGFTTHNRDGSISTFLDQARDWIARKRRGELI